MKSVDDNIQKCIVQPKDLFLRQFPIVHIFPNGCGEMRTEKSYQFFFINSQGVQP